MNEKRKVEIHCPGCNRETLLVRKPKYDGFKKVGEELSCATCGRTFEDEAAVAFKQERKLSIFDESDRSPVVDVFKGDPRHRLCRYCEHYVVNPFRQWCARQRREVEATDTCPQFEARPPEETPEDEAEEPRKGGILE